MSRHIIERAEGALNCGVTPITSVYSHCHTVLLLVFLSSLTYTPLSVCAASVTRLRAPLLKRETCHCLLHKDKAQKQKTMINEP